MTRMSRTRWAAMIGSFTLVASRAAAQDPAQVVLRDDLYIAGSRGSPKAA